MKIYENTWNQWKFMENNENQYENLWKSMKTNENQWKPMKTNENQWKSTKIVDFWTTFWKQPNQIGRQTAPSQPNKSRDIFSQQNQKNRKFWKSKKSKISKVKKKSKILKIKNFDFFSIFSRKFSQKKIVIFSIFFDLKKSIFFQFFEKNRIFFEIGDFFFQKISTFSRMIFFRSDFLKNSVYASSSHSCLHILTYSISAKKYSKVSC